MIRAVVGKVGDGKTMYLMQVVLNTLRYSSRSVVTNLTEIKLPEMNEYFHRHAEKNNWEMPVLSERLFIIPKEETQWFYRHRGHITLPKLEHREFARSGEEPYKTVERLKEYFAPVWAHPEAQKGVVYLTDEAHIYFPSKEMVKMDRILKLYATMHRHLNDDWWLASQLPKFIDPDLRDLVNEWWQMQNRYRMSFGPLQLPGGFVRRGYYDLPTGGARQEPFETTKFKLDLKGLATVYRTRGALGGPDGQPEEQARKKLPFWTIYPAAVVAAVLLGLGMMQLPKLAGWGIGKSMGAVAQSAQNEVGKSFAPPPPPPTVIPVRVDPPTQVVAQPGSRTTHVAPSDPGAVTVRGYVIRGKRVNVVLSDGRVLTEEDADLQGVDRNGAIVGGRKLYLAPGPSAAQPAVLPQRAPQMPVNVAEEHEKPAI